MIRKFLSCCIAALLIFSSIPSGAENATVKIYVSSETGSDSFDGSFAKPVKTVQAAVKLAEASVKNELPVNIIIRGGTYRFSEMLTLPKTFSGTEENSILFTAYEDEKVDFKGSVALDISKATAVTDPSVLERMYENVRDKVIVLDLAAQGIDKSQIFEAKNINTLYSLSGSNGLKGFEYNSIYLDNKEQSLSRWPNDRHYARWSKALNNQAFYYEESNVSRWTTAKNFWVGGFPQYDYSYSRYSVKEVDPVQKTITVIDGNSSPYTSYMTRRWAAFNLLEEIDVPGEFYIDRDNMLLYFYPPYGLKDASLEISLAANPILNIEGCSNITFKNINFSQTRSCGVRMIDVNNIDFISCGFRDISVNGIICQASQQAITSQTHWEKQMKNGSYNVDIKGCDFYNMGMSAIDMTGGDIDTLTKSNNVIEDCFITLTAQRSLWESIVLRGCGITVRNNNISNSPMQAIRPWGSLHLIEYNEIHDHLRENDDCGVIYWGGNQLLRGTMVQYNYLHDFDPIEPMVYNAKVGIYWDDCQSGQSAQYNIVKGVKTAFNSNGAGATLHRYNIAIDCKYPFNLIDHSNRQNEIVTMSVFHTIEETKNDIYDKELYYKIFPTLKDEMNGVNPKKFTQIYENLAVDCGEPKIGKQDQQFAFLKDNENITGKEVFADPDNQDYRLKSDSEIAKKYPNLLNDKNFDIDSIGMKRDVVLNAETAPFKLLLPKNGGAAVPPTKAEFVWEKALGATKYRLIVAKDRDLTHPVYDETVNFTDITLDNLEKGTNYYWTVYALNTSREFGTQWQSVSGVNSFSTAFNVALDTYAAELAISSIAEKSAAITESEAVGAYKIGTKKKIAEYSNLVSFFIKSKIPALDQKRLNAYTDILRTYLSNPDLVNRGFLNLAEHFKKEEWSGNLDVTPEYVKMELSERKNSFGGSNCFEAMTGNIVYCFDGEIRLPEGDSSYLTLGLSLYNDRNQWSGINMGYYIVVKNNAVELQKTNGTNSAVLDSKKISLCDDKPHQFKIGRIRLDTGNYIIVEIDSDPVFVYTDVGGSELTSSAQFVMAAYEAGSMIKLMPYSGEIPNSEAFENLEKEGLIKSAKTVYDLYNKDFSNYTIVSTNLDRIITANGIYEISHRAVADEADNVYVTGDTVEKMFNCSVTFNGSEAQISCNGQTVLTEVVVKDGLNMLSANDVCTKLGKSYTYDYQHGNYISADSGNLVVLNEITRLQKTKEMFKALYDLKNVKF